MQPEKVRPRNFKVEKIVYNKNSFSIAIGKWKGQKNNRFAMRWNGEHEKDQGYPNYGKYPMWFQLPDDVKDIIRVFSENDDLQNL